MNSGEVWCFNYREFGGGVSGLSNDQSQNERFERMINHWDSLESKYNDISLLGDVNIDHKRINEPNYNTNLVNKLKDYKTRTGMVQIIEESTRQQVVNGVIQSSLIDHIYNKRPELMKIVKVSNYSTRSC